MMFKPSSTYRIQFHKEFTFKHLEELIPYFTALGVKTIYASPIFMAIPGSTHGYDGVNPHQINPEIGTEAQLIKLTNQLKKEGISWVQDIVPNHMSFHPSNQWLMDVLEKWKESDYFHFFDLNFPTPLKDKRLMVPFIGESLADAIRHKTVQLYESENKLYLATGESHWPINKISYSLFSADFEKWTATKAGRKNIAGRLAEINNDEQLLLQIADAQYYRLCHWQETDRQITYRRFFIVNSLICLNINRPEVFDAFHQYVIELIKKDVFQGLRIDHIDGIADPTLYVQQLRNAVGPEVYIVVEKILAAQERMPQSWPVAGNTGYDFLATVNNLLTNKAAEKPFTAIYKEVNKKPLSVAQQILVKKREILFDYMRGELDHLVTLFTALKPLDATQQFTEKDIKEAIADFLIYCPVYRFYGNKFPLTKIEQKEVKRLIASIPKTVNNSPILSLLENDLISDKKKSSPAILAFYQRCMQFSGPLMAKGVEDTLMYTYNRFVGHTEVGDAPDAFGLTATEFHQLMKARLTESPYSMNGTATHDTKRGEDVRARLNVLSDIPERWISLAKKLLANTDPFGIHPNDAYLIFQTLLGAMPFNGTEKKGWEDRLMQYVEKALREAKKRSTWASPNEAYENEAKNFALSLLDPQQQSSALLHTFLEEITDASIINSLSQLVLKFTCPGIPDVYQGTELWDLSLVDPDNRRAVDYAVRQKMLKELERGVAIEELWADRKSGKIKLWLTQLLFQWRAKQGMLFEEGSYLPLEITGTYKNHLLAFMRRHENQWLVVMVPLGLTELMDDKLSIDWKDTEVVLPGYAPNRWKNLLSGESGQKDLLHHGIIVNSILDKLPFALVELEAAKTDRASGILMPIFSLPGKFGVGDIGPEAYRFVDFLEETGQKYWQLLPLNPTSVADMESPYSSYSAMAGNTLFISPEFLIKEGWLDKKKLKTISGNIDLIDYSSARKFKKKVIHIAYQNFVSKADATQREEFEEFCVLESYWLSDFSLFIALRNHHQGMTWNAWPIPYRTREKQAVQLFKETYSSEIEEINWQQFVFHQQWKKLRSYAKTKNIQFIGDLPFYVAYDSADVWAHPTAFKLDEKLGMLSVAGVPPDPVTPEGQRWGMPIFDWKALKKHDYKWWMERIKRNIELFDVVRIDHFRAIHTYWEIPVQELTAENGVWMEGPGSHFLQQFCKEFNKLPFVVEDLGEDMDGAIALRDQFDLAGMKILQFAFGEDMPESEFLPHHFDHPNCMVYVGTHDNNTAKGWYKNDLDKNGRAKLTAYLGIPVTLANVHLVMMRLALSSTAKIAVLQMQDILGLDEKARMNIPGTIKDNWIWRMRRQAISPIIKEWLLQQTKLFARA